MLKTRAGDVIGSTPDRVLSFNEIIERLGISKPTFFRSIKPQLPIVFISARRQGVRESDFEAWLVSRTRRAA
jgi:predicted DNA-binding transcriptional regulator AlpA